MEVPLRRRHDETIPSTAQKEELQAAGEAGRLRQLANMAQNTASPKVVLGPGLLRALGPGFANDPTHPPGRRRPQINTWSSMGGSAGGSEEWHVDTSIPWRQGPRFYRLTN